MKAPIYQMRVRVWLYSGMAAWHFATVPKKQSREIKKLFDGMRRGWGSLPVMATIGRTSWRTSIFPDKKRRAYLLPIKAEVRKKESIGSNDMVAILLEIKI